MPEGWYAITDKEKGVGLGVSYPSDIFPYLWYWQSFGGGFGYPWYGRTYNLGLEPFTSYTNQGLAQAIENGTALKMNAGQKIEAFNTAVVYTGSSPVTHISPGGNIKRKN